MALPGSLLQLEKVTKRYDSPAGSLQILNGVSFELGAGESMAIVGPSGSGKSTLLHIIGTLDTPSTGKVVLGGRELSQLNEMETAALRNRQIGFVFQAHYLLRQCTVLENVLVPTLARTGKEGDGFNAQPAHGLKESSEARATRLLKRVGLAERLSHRPGELSGGERQRVSVVRALINQPQLLLADEPTGALDHASAQQLGELLVQLNREEGVTLIVVTHAMELARRMGRVLQLKDGNLVPEENEIRGAL
jgi:lipoprotein-releasing system ATP-binding protein